MKLIFLFMLSLTFVISLQAQSEAVPRGENGFEAGYSHGFVKGKDINGAYLGYSLNGFIDFNAALASAKPNSAVSVGGSFHIGGEANNVGLALNGNYVFQDELNHFLYGATLYANLASDGSAMIPNFGVQFATIEDYGFTGILGVSVFTKGKTGLVFRPQFIYHKLEPYFVVGVGLLLRS